MLNVRDEALMAIQRHFHGLIADRAGHLPDFNHLQLPRLENLPRSEASALWFPVPGMYGGFKYWLVGSGKKSKLISESWCRVVDGSGQRHEISAEGCRLVDEGFV